MVVGKGGVGVGYGEGGGEWLIISVDSSSTCGIILIVWNVWRDATTGHSHSGARGARHCSKHPRGTRS